MRTHLSIVALCSILLACGGTSEEGDDGGSAGDGGGGGGATSPAAPTDLSGMPMAGGVHLTWTDASTNEDEFVVERAAAEGDFAEVARVVFDANQHHDATLPGPGTYRYRVGASNAAGVSYSATITVEAP